MKQDNQLRIALELIKSWSGNEPLHNHLTNEFRKHKQFGSRDRRLYSSLAYSWQRIGKLAIEMPPEKRLALASFLCNDVDNKIRTFLVEKYLPEGMSLLDATTEERLAYVDQNIDKKHTIFPIEMSLSDGVEMTEIISSMLTRPLVFIRITKGKEEDVDQELSQLYVTVDGIELPSGTRALAPGARLDDSFAVNKGYIEIQDLSSQLTGNFINPEKHETCWDACCGSGGKSLMLLNKFPSLYFHASDVRKSMLQNYSERLKKHGYSNFKTYEANLEEKGLEVPKTDFIVADVPCSGSGTWARTPEQAISFNDEVLASYIMKQQLIMKNIISSGKKGQSLFYITCSIFKAENEDQIEKLEDAGLVSIKNKKMIIGSRHGADSLFVAELEIV